MKTAESKSSQSQSSLVLVKAPKKTKQPEQTELVGIEKQNTSVTIYGMSPLIVNNFSSKSIQEMEDARGMDDGQRKEAKKKPRPPVVPQERFEAARILNENGEDCVCARWLKAMLVTACKYPDIEIESTKLRGAVYVIGDLLPIKYSEIKKFGATEQYPMGHPGKGPLLRRDVVRVGKFPNKQPDLRYRPEYRDWSIDLVIEFEPQLISMRGLFHLVRRAGTSVGLCEWRPEKSPAGVFGRFDIQGVRGAK